MSGTFEDQRAELALRVLGRVEETLVELERSMNASSEGLKKASEIGSLGMVRMYTDALVSLQSKQLVLREVLEDA